MKNQNKEKHKYTETMLIHKIVYVGTIKEKAIKSLYWAIANQIGLKIFLTFLQEKEREKKIYALNSIVSKHPKRRRQMKFFSYVK